MKILNKDKLAENIEKIALYDLENNNIFGSSYYVSQKGETLFKKHYTAENTEEIKVDDETLFRLASMTKPITAAAVMKLEEKGLLSLSDTVEKFLPEFSDIEIITPEGENLGKPKTKATILHLLTHTSGFGSLKPVNMTEEERKTKIGSIGYFIKQGLDFEPFSKEAYSPYGAFDILALIAEQVSGKDFSKFLEEEIFLPCKMNNTTFMPTDKQLKKLIKMHNKKDGKSVVEKTPEGCIFSNFPSEHCLGGAGLISSLSDYTNFVHMLLNKGVFENERIFSEESIKKISTAYVPKNIMTGGQNWGLGVRVITEEGCGLLPPKLFGWSGAYGSHFWVDPENEICAVYMKNSYFDGGAGNSSACRLEEAVYTAF